MTLFVVPPSSRLCVTLLRPKAAGLFHSRRRETSMTIDRRDFLQALASAVLFSTSAAAESAASAPPAKTSGWYDRPMRWAQLAFVEDDPENYDREFWLDYFRRIHADAACLSAGGCVAFYPTKVPLHYRSRWLKDTDPFKEMLEGC